MLVLQYAWVLLKFAAEFHEELLDLMFSVAESITKVILGNLGNIDIYDMSYPKMLTS